MLVELFFFCQFLCPSLGFVHVSLSMLRFIVPDRREVGGLYDVVEDAIRFGIKVDVSSYVKNI